MKMLRFTRSLTLSLFVYFVCFVVPPSYGASPVLGGISPRGGQRGTEAVFILSGARLGDAKELLFFSPGFTTSKLEVVNDTQVKATVKIAADANPGEHALRVR